MRESEPRYVTGSVELAVCAFSLLSSFLFLLTKVQGQTGPASVLNVPLFENHPFAPTAGAPENHEKNANSCSAWLLHEASAQIEFFGVGGNLCIEVGLTECRDGF